MVADANAASMALLDTKEESLDLNIYDTAADFDAAWRTSTDEQRPVVLLIERGPASAGPGIGIEDGLRSRDLTINALAEDEHGHLIDPVGGLRDLQARRLRMVSPDTPEGSTV